MPLRRAAGMCRDAVILSLHPDRYERVMQALFKRALPYSPLVEMADGDGHLFVDATGTGRLFGPPMDVARRLCRKVRTDLGLDPIWSVAPNKLVAKIASRLVKPVGEYIVPATLARRGNAARNKRSWLRCRSTWFPVSNTGI